MKLAHVFFDVHMGISHQGVADTLLAHKIVLQKGEVAIFVNRGWTRLKLYEPTHGVILYLNRPKGIIPEAIRHLPSYIEGKELRYEKALEAAMRQEHKKSAQTVKRDLAAYRHA